MRLSEPNPNTEWDSPRNDLLSCKLRGEWDAGRAVAAAREAGCVIVAALPDVRLFRCRVDPDARGLARTMLRANPDVERAEFDGGYRAYPRARNSVGTNDARIDECWYLKRHGFLRAWRHTTGDPGVLVGLADSGMVAHVDLPTPTVGFGGATDSSQVVEDDPTTWNHDGISWTDGAYWDIAACSAYDPADSYSHGTTTYALMFASPGNAEGGAGAAHGCGRWLTNVDGVDMYRLWDGVMKAGRDGVRVLNFSWGNYFLTGNGSTPDARDSEYARCMVQDWYDVSTWNKDHGVLQIGAAGNNNLDHGEYASRNTWSVLGVESYPEEFDCWVNVGHIGSDEDIWEWADLQGRGLGGDFGTPIEICAAGSNVLAPNIDAVSEWVGPGSGTNSRYLNNFGTSFSAPLVASAAALVVSINPELSADQVRDIVLQEADAGRHPEFHVKFPNAGVLNAHKAVLRALTTVPANAGNVYPYIDFWGAGENTTIAGGLVTTALGGSVTLEVSGYSSDKIARVELWVGATKVYDGPPAVMRATASGSGSAVRVVAHTLNGQAEETYDDIAVGALTVDAPFTARRVNATTISGTRPLGSTVTISPVTRSRQGHSFYVGTPGEGSFATLDPTWGVPTPSPHTLGAVTYPTATTWEAEITSGTSVLDGQFRARASTGESLFMDATLEGVYPAPGALPAATVEVSDSATWLVEVA